MAFPSVEQDRQSAIPELLPIESLVQLLDWYRTNLCHRPIVDPRGQKVSFQETDFIHLVKLTTKYGCEPKNRRMAVEQIVARRITFNPSQICISRAKELSWARSLAEEPDMIVPNWQVMGLANPGDAYIKNFGTPENPTYRVLICGHAGMKRWVVTIFPRERFADREIRNPLWP
jgi:hypothetical protein